MTYPKGPEIQACWWERGPKTRDKRHSWDLGLRRGTLKVGSEDRDPKPWKWIFRKFSQFCLKPSDYEWAHLLYAFVSILYVSHYPIIRPIHFKSFIILMSYSFPVVAKTSTIQVLWNLEILRKPLIIVRSQIKSNEKYLNRWK